MKLPQAFSPAVMAELARPVASFDYRNAEMVEGVTPAWFVVETYPYCEREVAEELAARRIGIYLPEEDETIIKRGRAVDQTRLMFPGYVFVFTWLTEHNFARIRYTPGVQHFLMMDGKPVVVSDEAIDRIRYCENCARPVMLQSFEIEQDVIPKKRKRWRKAKKKTIVVRDEVIAVRPWSAFEDAVMTLDSVGRISALQNLLGIGS